MTYALIPNPGDNLSVSQGDIKTNFTVANTSFGINHVPFNVATNTGKHNICELVNASGVPGSLAAGEGTLYTLTGATGSNLYYTDDATSNQWQLTRVIDAFSSYFAAFVNNYNPGSGVVGTAYTGGWTFLPGGMLLQYGLYNAGAGGLGSSGTIKFPTPYTSTPFIVLPVLICKASGTTSVHNVSVINGTVTSAQFQWNLDSATTAQTGIYWIAIGI